MAATAGGGVVSDEGVLLGDTMSFVSEEIIDKIGERNDIAAVISEYVSLKRSGANLKALCPFHTEKTPSFVVNTQKQIFHCFGCGEGGNVFSFLMKIENIEFPDALKMLAERSGIEISYSERHDDAKDEKNRLLKLMSEANEYYHKNLLDSKEAAGARLYLKNRGIDLKTVSRYKIGYAPFKTENADYPKFRNRVIFPIFDVKNRVLGFGGRVLDNSLPKYINSPDSKIYHKGEILYGLNFAKEGIRKSGSVFVVEGYFDLIRMQMFGIENTVATLGTALTANQIRLLKRLCERIYFVYDPDTAGQSAALRGMELVKSEDIDVRVISLPNGQDPDTFLLSNGKDAFVKLQDSALDFFDFCFSRSLGKNDVKTVSGKTKVIEALADIVYSSPNPIERDSYVKKVADKLCLKEDLVVLTLQKLRKGRQSNNVLSKSLDVGCKGKSVEKKMIQLLIKRPELVPEANTELAGEDFDDPVCRDIYMKLGSDLSKMTNQNLLSELVCEDVDYGGNEKRFLADYLKKIKANAGQNKLRMLSSEIKSAQDKNDDNRVKDLLAKYQELKGRREGK